MIMGSVRTAQPISIAYNKTQILLIRNIVTLDSNTECARLAWTVQTRAARATEIAEISQTNLNVTLYYKLVDLALVIHLAKPLA